ncbi:hypothetical protein RO3G_03865 [Rhizopus delemar RA 99-880]|uniref:Uncharacterized protein n=1 Tax=Rhizopus delemar (strain RA 99-880 / ATCC MYA-4621 / FGSC 9543 / NRRL 43880) TaxID=246409 RepID=I1BSI0_RHIO9|nr:hypothetical protein RO3G_03865 [Rhizopus delemar RA 99-880]|eukprot:EIE79160.1 hypothetical protein RO3G_03865 [Rhizopus delemar RA 99-880]
MFLGLFSEKNLATFFVVAVNVSYLYRALRSSTNEGTVLDNAFFRAAQKFLLLAMSGLACQSPLLSEEWTLVSVRSGLYSS